jgi:hypothetical protein
LLWLVELESLRVAAVPLKLEYCHTRLAHGDDLAWIRRRLESLGGVVELLG